jgi:hypothetical protein
MFGKGMLMRCSLFSILVGVVTAAVLCVLNVRTTETVTEPYYVGAAPPPPPYGLKFMTVTLHSDRGWPIWHTRASNHFAAHNAALFLDEGGFPYEQATPQTDYVRAGIDFVIGLLILIATAAASEAAVRTFRRRPVNVDDLYCPEAELGHAADTGRI